MKLFSRRGCLSGLALLVAALVAARFGWYPFLSRMAPVPTTVLVIEGWLEDQQLEAALEWARQHRVKTIYTTGGPLTTGSYLIKWNTFAEMTHARLVQIGADQSFQILAAPAKKVPRDRTREAARALHAAAPNLTAFNLVSSGPHTRRSWRTFRREFDPLTEIGCIAVPPPDYGPRDWWRSSEGIKTMISETAAYLHDVATGVF